MKKNISAVIICLNAADTIKKAILSLQGITTDIIVSDSGSTDGTIDAVASTGATLLHLTWIGYGANKNMTGEHAQNDWLLSLDADEYIRQDFAHFIEEADFTDINKIYQFKRLNFLGSKPIRFGEWSKDKVTRLFNRGVVSWDQSLVHEQLISKENLTLIKSKAVICHRTAADIISYRKKIKKYAALMAQKYFAQRKKISWLKIYGSPVFNFIQNYFFRLGILDGKEGFQIAMAHSGYTFDKYRMLKDLHKSKDVNSGN